MGMFDSINLKIKCPYCGQEDIVEAQTKELECLLHVYSEGDYVSDQYNYLDCLADCRSKLCVKDEVAERGYKSGFGRMFDVRIFIEDGKISGEYKILPEED